MNYFFFCSMLLVTVVRSFGQKPAIDTSVLGRWPYLANATINDYGNYAAYRIENHLGDASTLVIKALDSQWEKKIIGVEDGIFLGRNNQFMYHNKDTIFFLTLGKDSTTFISNVKSYKYKVSSLGDWIAYQLKNDEHQVVVFNIITRKEYRVSGVDEYFFNDNGAALILKVVNKNGNSFTTSLLWFKLLQNEANTFWSMNTRSFDCDLSGFCFDRKGSQVAFIAPGSSDKPIVNSIWYYKDSMENAVKLPDSELAKLQGLELVNDYGLQFSEDGKKILFKFKKAIPEVFSKMNRNVAGVDIWTYKDVVIQPQQPKEYKPQINDGFIDIYTNKFYRITSDQEEVVKSKGDYLIIRDNKADSQFWWQSKRYSYYLFSMVTKTKTFLTVGPKYAGSFIYISPGGRFIVYFDQKLKEYISYDILRAKAVSISSNIHEMLENEGGIEERDIIPVGIAGWRENDASIFIYGNYDIWETDLLGKAKPINLTNCFGCRNHIKLRILSHSSEDSVIRAGATLLLTGFDCFTKDNGFYKISIDNYRQPVLLTKGPFYYYLFNSQIAGSLPGIAPVFPVKAKAKDVWIIQRMSESEPPNYFITRDFKSFVPLSHLQPQSQYNWLTTELVRWKQLDGTVSEGILYKPENFDSKKKYPIIFTYYEKASFSLHVFLMPEFTDGPINIPWFVSNGYLVFRPDIHYSIARLTGKTVGWNAYNSIFSAAKYFSKQPWVNSKRMAINGHSFGGSETNQVLARTNIFAAAAESAGGADAISSYLDGTVNDRQNITEMGQGRVGATPWQRPELYLRNSAVLKANQITTPLLILHNKGDHAVPWTQGVELFMALRRLGKKVWLLQYDGEGHTLAEHAALKDYSIRLMQFLNHYLKDEAPAIWMTKGIAAYLKGIETGYNLENAPNERK